ncbi:uncharacterized protein BDV14DRAFT_182284 [Aspergillus stella-maris]|uniref:uncharacterized protein n=1 Tax=Aspergillus stella-maris TaxID=1810926 RepID=UPI003CCDE4B0
MYVEDPFFMAVKKRRLDVLRRLLDRYNKYGWNCLHVAVVFDDYCMVRTLQHKVPLYGSQKDHEGRTPLDLAFFKCNAKIVKLLLEFGCLTKYTMSGTLLGHCVVSSCVIDERKSKTEDWISILDGMLLRRVFDPKAKDNKGRTAYDLSRSYGIFDARFGFSLRGKVYDEKNACSILCSAE